MFKVSKKDALKYTVVTKCVHEFNMDICSTKDKPVPKSLNKVLLFATD